jgi:hypothetical protein
MLPCVTVVFAVGWVVIVMIGKLDGCTVTPSTLRKPVFMPLLYLMPLTPLFTPHVAVAVGSTVRSVIVPAVYTI